jgi:hypothetical protein
MRISNDCFFTQQLKLRRTKGIMEKVIMKDLVPISQYPINKCPLPKIPILFIKFLCVFKYSIIPNFNQNKKRNSGHEKAV